MTISGELDYRIRYDVEHDLFHAQNVFSEEYITPTFIEYVQKLEKENKVLAQNLEDTEIINKALENENAELKARVENQKSFLKVIKAKFVLGKLEVKEIEGYLESDQLTKAKEIMKHLLDWQYDEYKKSETDKELFKVIGEAEQFLNSEVKNDITRSIRPLFNLRFI